MIKRSSGVVAVLDALGTSDLTGTEEELGAERRRRVFDYVQSIVVAKRGILKVGPDGGPQFLDFPMTIRSAGMSDTIQIAVEAQDPLNTGLFMTAPDFCSIYVNAVMEGELYRGAVAVGEYLDDGVLLSGPAVTSAGKFYDKTEWAGVVLEPSTGARCAMKPFPAFWAPYDVPTKSGLKSLWSLGWPPHSPRASTSPEALRAKVVEIFDRAAERDDVALKREATLEFFDRMNELARAERARRDRIQADIDRKNGKV